MGDTRVGRVWPLYAARIWSMGKSSVFPVCRELMAALNASEGDLVLVRVHLPYVTFRLAVTDRSIPVDSFTPAELPPEPEALRAATVKGGR